MSNLHALIERYVGQLKDLENRVAEVKRKLDVVTEAVRLLEEEGPQKQFSSSR